MGVNKERVELLAQALESGEFRQGTGALRKLRAVGVHEFSYCCLGVACEVFKKETGEGKWAYESSFQVDGYKSSMELPLSVQEWYGFASSDPTLTVAGASAISLNDIVGATFGEIAALFRKLD